MHELPLTHPLLGQLVVDQFGKGGPRLVGGDIEHTDGVAGQYVARSLRHFNVLLLPADAADPKAHDLITP